ncbi:hypothetical protein F5Y15DRAFT_389575 [Xylariaceae sp. FL0016]|nr:hypothetical protein F5Y15DRAFT_389575 [Xylariaceae sp. FL0016]
MSHPHEPYSTLEPTTADPEAAQKEVVFYPDHSLPQAVPAEHGNAKEVVSPSDYGYYKPDGAGAYPQYPGYTGAYVDPNATSPAGTYGPGATPMSGTTSDVYSQYAAAGAMIPPGEKAPKKATICGLSKKAFWITLVIAIIVIIGAIVGGVVGGLAADNADSGSVSSDSSSSSPDGSSSNSTSDAPQKILDISKITASNWTDGDGVTHRTVFFQDAYMSIIAARWESNGKTWETDNLTEMMAATTRPLNPQPGTPLASASMDLDPKFETHLWFTDPWNMIRSMANTDPVNSPSGWDNDTLDEAQLETWPGGQLAAMWQRCWHADCDGTWIVAYQRPEGAIKTANSSTWASATVAVNSSDVAANSSLAVIPQLDGVYLDRLELASEAISSSSTTGTMSVTNFADTWDASNERATTLLSDIPEPTTRQQFAATKWDNWNQALYLALLPDGTVRGNHWDGSTMNSLTSISFNDGPDVNFTAIAMTPDAMLYGISNDEILEYSLDTSDPSQFNYIGKVLS